MTTQLVKQETRIGITKEYATYLLKTVWPGAPDDAVVKAALICSRYGLDPLLKEVSIIKFDKYAGRGPERRKIGEDWVPVLGIKASRKIARHALGRQRYSYLDGPRVMTDQEQKDILGAVDPDRIWAITKLCVAGAVYPGYGNWPKADMAYGSEKGNSQRNMAFIRSERNAIDRMVPGEMPEDIEVGDESFVPLKVDGATLEQGKKDAEQLALQATNDAYGPEEANGK